MAYQANLKKASIVAVHFVLPSDIEPAVASTGLAVMETSIAGIAHERDLLTRVATAMQFPEYFGGNWDALDECLSDMSWLPADGYVLVLNDAAKAWSQCPYLLGLLVTAWLEGVEYWMENEKPFHLVFVM